jgi:hypothetical protein
VGTLNTRGIAGKIDDLIQEMERLDLDLVFVTETWARPDRRVENECIVIDNPSKSRVGDTGHFPHGVAVVVHPRHVRRRVQFHPLYLVEGKSIWFSAFGVLFGGVYLPPSITYEECMCLLAVPEGIDVGAERIILGDFNMRVGSQSGDVAVNERGAALFGSILEMGLVNCRMERATATYLSNNGQSIVDYIFMSEELSNAVYFCDAVEDNDIGGSDHRLVYVHISRPAITPEEAPAEACINLKKLAVPEFREAYEEAILVNLTPLGEEICHRVESRLVTQEAIDEWSRTITATIKSTAMHVLGPVKNKRRESDLAKDVLVIEAKRIRRAAFENWRKQKRTERRQELWDDYQQKCIRQNLEVQRAKKRAFQKFCDEMACKNATEQLKVLRNIKVRRTRGGSRFLSSKPEHLEVYKRFFEGQFSRRDFHATYVQAMHGEEEGIDEEMLHIMNAITVDHLAKRCKNGKSAGLSGLKMELIKYGGLGMMRVIAFFFQACIVARAVPAEWRIAGIVPVPKKGDLSKIENYRPISITEVLRKLFEKTIMLRLSKWIEPLSICQGGFRAHRSTVDQIAALQEAIIQKKKALKRTPYLVFLDIKAAYDTVDRALLWRKMAARGTNACMIGVLTALFDANKSAVLIHGKKSDDLNNEMGLLQGSILSPMLYSVFIDDLAVKLRAASRVRLGDVDVGGFFYADDIALLAESVEEMHYMLSICEEHSLENGYRFAPNKCEYISEEPVEFMLYNQPLKRTATFTYLGAVMSADGLVTQEHISRLIGRSLDTMHFFKRLGMNGHGFNLDMNRRIYLQFIRPKIEYALSILEKSEYGLKKLQVFQNLVLKTALSVGRGTSTAAIHELMNIPTMLERGEELFFRWWCRLQCLPEGTLIREAWKTFERQRLPNSVFAQADSNEMVLFDRQRNFFARKMNAHTKEQRMAEAINEARTARRHKSDVQHARIKALPPKKFQSIDEIKNRQVRRWLTLWSLRQAAGKPRPCKRCGVSQCTIMHMQSCCNIDIDVLLRNGQLAEAFGGIKRVMHECLEVDIPISEEDSAVRNPLEPSNPRLRPRTIRRPATGAVTRETRTSAETQRGRGRHGGRRAHADWRVHNQMALRYDPP